MDRGFWNDRGAVDQRRINSGGHKDVIVRLRASIDIPQRRAGVNYLFAGNWSRSLDRCIGGIKNSTSFKIVVLTLIIYDANFQSRRLERNAHKPVWMA